MCTGVRNVRGWLPIQGPFPGFHWSLGSADQEDQAGLARTAEQCQQETLRDVQERGFRPLHARPLKDDEERPLTKSSSKISLTYREILIAVLHTRRASHSSDVMPIRDRPKDGGVASDSSTWHVCAITFKKRCKRPVRTFERIVEGLIDWLFYFSHRRIEDQIVFYIYFVFRVAIYIMSDYSIKYLKLNNGFKGFRVYL